MSASPIAWRKREGRSHYVFHFSQHLYSCPMADALPRLSSHLIVLITNLALRKAYCAKGCLFFYLCIVAPWGRFLLKMQILKFRGGKL